MKHATILMLCVPLAALAADCRPEKTTREGQSSAKSSGGDQPGLAQTPGSTMARRGPMDFSLPPDDDRSASGGASGNASGSQTSPNPGAPGDLKGALADLDRILVRQMEVAKLWQTIDGLAAARKHQQALIKGALDVLALTISSMKKAVALSKSGLARFLDKHQAQAARTRKMSKTIKAKQRMLASQPGGKAFFEELKRSATVEVRKHSQTLLLLGRQLLRRKEELKR